MPFFHILFLVAFVMKWRDVACQVAVLEGRHFQDFATGDSGVVIRSDVDAQTCQVRHRA